MNLWAYLLQRFRIREWSRSSRYLMALLLLAIIIGLVLLVLTILFVASKKERITYEKRSNIEMKRLINSWLEENIVPKDTDTLQSLWTNVHPVSPPFESNGVPKLVGKLHTDPFFKDCGAARRIGVGYFQTGGGIQTVKDFGEFLSPCDQKP